MNTLAVDGIHQLLGALRTSATDRITRSVLLGSKLEVLDPHVGLALRLIRQMSLERS